MLIHADDIVIISTTREKFIQKCNHTGSERPNITIKFVNFCKKNLNTPLHCKSMILGTCARSPLTHASETWGIHHSFADSINRQGLKSALGIRPNTNNEVAYVETNRFPLQCYIQKQQHNFWL